jgi:KipI family sensor histidine kinase inhibitor
MDYSPRMESLEKKPGFSQLEASAQAFAHPAWRWVSERGLLVATGEATLARYEALISGNFHEIQEMIPADGSLLLVLRQGATLSADLRTTLVAPLPPTCLATGILHEIKVEYGGAAGPDLPELAALAEMDPHSYIDSHAAMEYQVAFLGFQPGFPYLRGLPCKLHAPRRPSPRVRVAAGSVAIGGAYCGIYPAGGPGGWQIIGHTDSVLFDPAREAPALLMPGDRVRFVPR